MKIFSMRLLLVRTMMNRMGVPGLLFFSILPASVLAWGPVGHETIAYIAQDHLSAKAKSNVDSILGPGQTMASVSNWADQIRFKAKYTAPWHFIDLPIRRNLTVNQVKDYYHNGNCVVVQTKRFLKILHDPNEPLAQRLIALKFVIHLVGDLHQPLHCADDNDEGGNEKIVRFKTPGWRGRGSPIKLHALWDRLLEIHTEENPRALADQLEQNISENDKKTWVQGSLDDWAFESYQIAKYKIYPGFEAGPGNYSNIPLPKDYYFKMRPLVDLRLEQAGIRLAYLLNSEFK